MAMDADDALHFEAAMLDDEPTPWSATKVADVIAALGEAGLAPEGDADPVGWAASNDRTSHTFSGAAGQYALVLDDSGGWFWDTPYPTLMRNRHFNRPEAVKELIDAVCAITSVAPPYYGCTWYAKQGLRPWWMLTRLQFKAHDGRAIQFFGHRYLELHNGGAPFPDPPCTSRLLADGQFLIAAPKAFGEARTHALLDITDYLEQRV
jgi:hypothetical protein